MRQSHVSPWWITCAQTSGGMLIFDISQERHENGYILQKKTGWASFASNSTQLRLNIISRYMAYHLIRLMEIPHEDPIMKNVRITVWREREKLASKFIVGDKAVLVQGTPYPISELETTYDALKF